MSIDLAYIKAYSNNLMLLCQQKGSRLRNAVTVETGVVGEKKFVDQIASMTATTKKSRIAPTPITEPTFKRRMITMYTYEHAPVYDTIYDLQKMLVDPKSKLTQSAIYAMGRAMDQLIIDAANGTAYYGKEGASSIALPSAQKVAAASSGLTIAKLLAAKQKLDEAEVDQDDPRFIVCTAEQIGNLLGTTQVTSADYNTVKALASGQIDSFLGFKFIRSELVAKTSTSRFCLAFAKSGIALAIGKDVNVKVDERADLSYATQIYASMTLGAARIEEEKVVEIACIETA